MTARARIRGLVNRFGYDIVRRGAPAAPSFYKVSPTCQIPNLGFILERTLGQTTSGQFVEVGAFDGYTYSNTWGLAELGWQGLYIEPVPAFAEACRTRYAGNERIRVIEVAVGNRAGDVDIHVSGAYSTADEATFAEDARLGGRGTGTDIVTVPVRTLDEVLLSSGIAPGFDLLVVDVEGMEPEVFAGLDLGAWQPRLVVVELTDLHPTVSAHRDGHRALAQAIADAGYDIAFKDQSNTIFQRRVDGEEPPTSGEERGEVVSSGA